MKPAEFHILLALADGDRHGYAVMQTVREQSAGRVPLQTGSFYRHLSRLIEEGFVVEAPAGKGPLDPRRGVNYRLTARGKQALAAEKQRMSQLVAHMNKLRIFAK